MRRCCLGRPEGRIDDGRRWRRSLPGGDGRSGRGRWNLGAADKSGLACVRPEPADELFELAFGLLALAPVLLDGSLQPFELLEGGAVVERSSGIVLSRHVV
ncbi:MAG: hypothetical protein V7647_1566 [Acidobacteriota bacterium]